jgi:O-antigen ligase
MYPLMQIKHLASSIYGRRTTEWDQPRSVWWHLVVLNGLFGGLAFALTAVYTFATIISPEQFGNGWEDYHALTILGGLILLLSLPGILTNIRLRSSMQIFLLLGFIGAMGVSEVANGWFGGVIVSWKLFLPSAVIFFFIVANVTTARRLKILTLVTIASCLVVVVEALCGYYSGFLGETFLVRQSLFSGRTHLGELIRIRGAGFLSDPNDFAQILLIALPLTFIFWRRKRFKSNLLTVIAPAALLLWAIYLTHSRGALIALAVLVMIAIRSRLGTTGSVLLTSLLIMGMLAMNFTGGRLISADAGADRLSLWASGLQMFKRAPIFGVGFGKFNDSAEMTAHNSFVLCLAELGFVGSTFWIAFLVTTMMGLNRIIGAPNKQHTELPSATDVGGGGHPNFTEPVLPSRKTRAALSISSSAAAEARTEIGHPFGPEVPRQWVVAMRLAMISFIVTSWFLSRAYESTVYLVVGLATAAIMLQQYGDESPVRIRWVSYTLAIESVAIVFIYEVVRLRF